MTSKAHSFHGFPRQPSGTEVVKKATTLDYASHFRCVRCDIYSAVKLEKTGITSVDDLEKGQRRTGSLRTCKACNYSELYMRWGILSTSGIWVRPTMEKVFTRNKS